MSEGHGSSGEVKATRTSPQRQDAKMYSFKSIGELHVELAERNKKHVKKPPIGIKTPLEFGGDSGIFKMHTDLGKQIADNLRNLILTNHGERLGNYYFGANLMPLAFRLGETQFDEQAMLQIKDACRKFLPFVQLEGFAPSVETRDTKEVSKIDVLITYRVPRVNSDLRALRVRLYTG